MKRRNRRGASIVVVAIALPVLLGMVALTIDIGRLVVEKQRLQRSCDAAVLAGGANPNQAEQTANEYFAANVDGAVVPDVKYVSGEPPRQLTVAAKKEVPMIFAPALGIHTGVVHAESEAEITPMAKEIVNLVSSCSAGRWWVTNVKQQDGTFGPEIGDGSKVDLTVGQGIKLTRDTKTVQSVADSLVNRGPTVKVLLVDKPDELAGGKQVLDSDTDGQTTFKEYAEVRILPPTDQDKKDGILWVNVLQRGTGSLKQGEWFPLAFEKDRVDSDLQSWTGGGYARLIH